MELIKRLHQPLRIRGLQSCWKHVYLSTLRLPSPVAIALLSVSFAEIGFSSG